MDNAQESASGSPDDLVLGVPPWGRSDAVILQAAPRLISWRDNAAVQPNLSITDFEAFPYVQYGMGREAGLADYSLEWLDIRPKVELRTGSPLLVPFVLTKSPLVALVPKRLA